MKVLITGATGLVGKAIVDLCLKENIGVNYLTTRKDKIRAKNNYNGFFWNPSSNEIDLDCFKGVSAIINLAGASVAKRWTSAYKKEILDSRLDSLKTLYRGLRNVEKSTITSFVSASAVGIYPSSLSNFYSEDEAVADDSFLGKVVVDWEEEAAVFHSLNINVANIRIGTVLSLHGGALPEMDKAIRNYAGAPFGTGEQWHSWIHIDDLARLFLFVIENSLQGIYNGVAPNPVTNYKLTKEIAKNRNKPLLLPNIPQFVMTTVLGEMSYVLFSSQRVSSKKIEEEGFVFDYQNICIALKELYSEEKKKLLKKKNGKVRQNLKS